MTISQRIKEFVIPDEKSENINTKENNNSILKMKDNSNQNLNDNEIALSNENFKLTLNGILQQLNQIQEGHSHFLSILNNLQLNIDNNYSNLNQRIKALEKYYSKNNNIKKNNNANNSDNNFKEEINVLTPNKELKEYKENKNINIDEIKSKFMNGHYNEALHEAKQNEKCLFKLYHLSIKILFQKLK